jgi:hypothetical protein
MQNDEKIAAIAFVNARERASKYATGVYDLLADAIRDAAKDDADVATEESGDGESDGSAMFESRGAVDFERYVGRYVRGMGASETAVVRWKGGIATLRLPTDNPRGSLTVLRHVEGDTFRQVRRNGELGGEVIFDTDDQGRVIRMRNPINYSTRVN